MPEGIWVTIISSITAILVAYIGVVSARTQKKIDKASKDEERRNKEKEEKDKTRDEMLILICEYMEANGKALEACCVAIAEGKTNGELKAAKQAQDKAKQHYESFIRKQGIAATTHL